jgi:hypothetical protein
MCVRNIYYKHGEWADMCLRYMHYKHGESADMCVRYIHYKHGEWADMCVRYIHCHFVSMIFSLNFLDGIVCCIFNVISPINQWSKIHWKFG